MKSRIEVGTDVAMIGAWDASRNGAVVAKSWGKEWDSILNEDAARGDLFLIHTGADWGGQIDVYCDSEIPPQVRARTRPIVGEFLICVPTGRLVVGGVEDYRSDKPQITGENSVVQVPCGNYQLKCFMGEEEETGPTSPIGPALEKAVGSEDYRYFRRIETGGLLGYLILLLYPILAVPFSWKIALPSTVGVLLAFFWIREKALERNARYQRILQTENKVFREARGSEAPAFILELQRVEGVTDLKGGSVSRKSDSV